MTKPQLAVAAAAGAHQNDQTDADKPGSTKRQRARQRPHLAEPVVVAEWWRDRSGHAVRVSLSTFNGHNLVDVRTWWTKDGKLKPGRGFAANVRHLPKLATALAKATRKAVELGLIDIAEAEPL
jgi:transcriptional coactivator p15 (PC4)